MHFIKNGHYYKILHGGKYYRLINPRRLFLFTIIPSPADATVTLTATGYTQVGNTISVPAGTQVSWSVSKSGIPTQTGTETITEPKTIYVTIGYPRGTVLFESSTPGTYNINVLYPCTVHVDVVGGGGGGWTYGGSFGYTSCSGGGSGAYVHGTLNINAGVYSIVVGSGGNGSTSGPNASNGGQSSCFGQAANGGEGGKNTGGGSGGGYSINVSTLTGVNGNGGGTAYSKNPSTSGGASKYGGYGAGGGANKSTAYKGGNGYVKIYVE